MSCDMTTATLRWFTQNINTAIIQAPDDYKDGSGTIIRKLNEFRATHGEEWILLRGPLILEDGSLLAILIRWDMDDPTEATEEPPHAP